MASSKNRGTPPISITAKTEGQQRYIDAIDQFIITFGIGSPGTGKTHVACLKALQYLHDYKVGRIILVRPAVEACHEKIGFLPGTMEEKMDPFLQPIYDAFSNHIQPERIEEMMARREIEVVPLAFMRGRTLDNAFIIVDEAQNITQDQMIMLLTRLGEGSRMVISGDLKQRDLAKKEYGGLESAFALSSNPRTSDRIGLVEFTKADCVRHPLIKDIMEVLELD